MYLYPKLLQRNNFYNFNNFNNFIEGKELIASKNEKQDVFF